MGLVSGVPFAFGKRLYGFVDGIPGVFHVATFFYHVAWFPVVPVESWIFVTDSCGYDEARSMPIGLNLQSVVVGWVRAIIIVIGALAILACLGVLTAAVAGRASLSDLGVAFALVIGAVVLYRLTGIISVASHSRAEQLALKAGFPPNASQELIVNAGSRLDAIEREPTSVPCPSCGRFLASTSRVCPRCEHRFQ